MTTVRAGDLLALWEQAEGLGPVQRALSLAAATGADPQVLWSEPVGRTNDFVLALREELVGPVLAATATCPACHAVVEFTVEVGALRRPRPGPATATVVSGETRVEWRAPTPADLIAVAGEPMPERALLRRCVRVLPTAGRADDSPTPDAPDALLDDLPDGLVEQLEQAMAGADPLSEVLVELSCAECSAAFTSDLDLGSFVWAEVDTRARRLLHEVDVLARAYGWTEHEVLSLTECRRASYLRIVLEGAP